MSVEFTPPDVATYYRARLPKLNQRGAAWRCPCPIHNGKRDSFAVDPKTGRAICHSGCGQGWDIIGFEQALSGSDFGTAKEAVFRAIGREIETRGGQKVVAEYPYTDAAGTLLFQVVRFEPKGFRQRRPDGQGGWIWNLKGVDPVPYRLPEVFSAEVVYVVEGERDVETLEKWGLVATCNPMGAGKWRPDYADYFEGKDVVILPDQDEPGQKHAIEGVAVSVLGKVASVRIVNVPAKDVTEWAEKDGNRVDFDVLVRNAENLTAETLAAWQGKHRGDKVGLAARDDSNTVSRKACKTTQRPTAAQRLTRLTEGAQLFCDPAKVAYARITVGSHHEVWSINSSEFRQWLTREYYRSEGKPLGSQPLNEALSLLEAEACFGSSVVSPVSVRVAGLDDAIYLDLCDREWTVVKITPAGWTIVSDPPVRFRRTKGMLPLPAPVPGGTVEELRSFVNAPDDENWILIVAWAISALRPDGPFPILVVQGEQGSGKSTTALRLRQLVDPSSCPLRSTPRSERDLLITAHNSWVLGFDNLSGLKPWLSDALCRLATGGGFSTRALYSDMDETLITATRPQILNGIDEIATRDDLADRALVVNLPRMSEEQRKEDARLNAEFSEAQPGILGALLDAVVAGLRNFSSVKLPRLPRMADFAKWVYAAESALPWREGAFAKVYEANRQNIVSTSLESNPVASACLVLIQKDESWEGTATELLTKLTALVSEDAKRSPSWPKTAQGLSGKLRRCAPFLREKGIEVTFSRDRQQRLVSIHQSCGDGDDDARVPPGAISSPNQPPCSQPLTGSCDGGDDGDERFLTETQKSQGADGTFGCKKGANGKGASVTSVTSVPEPEKSTSCSVTGDSSPDQRFDTTQLLAARSVRDHTSASLKTKNEWEEYVV